MNHSNSGKYNYTKIGPGQFRVMRQGSGKTAAVTAFSDDPINGMTADRVDKWYLFREGSQNCKATLESSSKQMYAVINREDVYAELEVVNGDVEYHPQTQEYLWNPNYNCLLPITIRSIEFTNGARLKVDVVTEWEPVPHAHAPSPDQCVWYRNYTLDNKDEYTYIERHALPDWLSHFKLPGPQGIQVPEFKNGDEVYAWIESQLD